LFIAKLKQAHPGIFLNLTELTEIEARSQIWVTEQILHVRDLARIPISWQD
jgi:hypothetical protein